MKNLHALMPACLLLTASAMAAPSNIGSAGDIHFTITIKAATCELENDSIDVNMETVVLQRPVKVGKELNQKNFSIGLKDCAYATKASVTMDGSPDPTDPSLFAPDSGGATGVALKIKTSGGEQQYPSSTDSTPVEHTVWFDGTNKLNYIASYVPVKPDATVGTANATVNFSVTYE
ncbi:long polar fimbrial protein LpfE [Salmonella enterica subsp. enterica serovar Typhimurium]|nr:long polar fimbrial protein LpfE [Salmonella enterica subsp. enterica serovar Typhimurium]QSG20390.1 long polar fimbrial protein LpfE [Salmonella enterica subsp. enterica serovar Typhimurium]QSG23309.1 long polar fimbrial protein LpfE [Salmonella enterica subsp. enterica serovar Typhimurium]